MSVETPYNSTAICGSSEVVVYNLKLVLLGESSVGKTSIVSRFTTGNFNKSNATIGAAFMTKNMEVLPRDGDENRAIKRINMEIWDTAGQERYRSLAPMYYRNTDVALIVFDVTKLDSFSRAQSWIDELKSYVNQDTRDDITIVLVGNKVDLLELDENALFDLGNVPHGNEIIRVSAKTGEGIAELFEHIARIIPDHKFKSLKQLQEGTKQTASNSIKLNAHSKAWTKITERTACEC